MRGLGWLVVVGVVAVAVGSGSSGAVAAVAPPDQWGFEQVTPVNKGGGSVQSLDTFQARSDGQAFLLSASAPFAAVPAESAPLYTRYLARRTMDGWVNRALEVPFDPIPPASNSAVASVIATSHNLAYAVVSSTRALAPGAIAGGGNVYLRDTADGSYRLVAASPSSLLTVSMTSSMGGLSVQYVAADGKSVVFLSPVPLVDDAPDPGYSLYRWTEALGLELVSKAPDEEGGAGVVPSTAVGYGFENGARQSLPRIGGSTDIFFSSSVDFQAGPAYHWSDGEVSVVSKSQIPNDPSPAVAADVIATTSNADFALLWTRGPDRLTSDAPTFDPDTPERETARVLYRYERSSGDLTYVGVADVETYQSADQMSDDGRTVVFRSRQQLTPDAAAFYGSGDPNNRQNLYVWRDGTLRFVTSFDPGVRMNGGGWLRTLSENGKYLAFVDSSQGTANRFGVSDNTSLKCASAGSNVPALCDQVYVFDVEQADSLECASCRPSGGAPRGQSGDPGISQGEMRMNGRQVQTVANDGTAFFSSTEDFVPEDGNGQLDVYAYRHGTLRLVSGGVQGGSARFLDATPDGSSIFFATNAQLAETDSDRSVDVYVTRLGAGYADQRPLIPPICQGGDCRVPGSGSESGPPTGGGSEASPGGPQVSSKVTKARVRLIGAVRRKGSLRITVRVTTEGRLRVSGAQIKTAVRNPRRAGDLTVSVPLSKKARTTIQRGGRLRARIRVSLTPPFGSSATSTSIRTVR